MCRNRWAAIAALTMTALVGSAPLASAAVPAKQHTLPKDVCALVTDEQVAALVPSATSDPTASTKANAGCRWDDGREVPTSLNSLNVTVVKLSGVPTAQVKLSMKGDALDNDGEIIKGLGSFATQQSVIPPNTEVGVWIPPLLVTVEFSGGAPVTNDEKAKTLDIARAVVNKL
jgi:hypothetical protein